MTKAVTGLAGAALLGSQPVNAESMDMTMNLTDKSIGDLISIKLPSLERPTEKKQAISSIAMPKDKRIGYAVVGLGSLTLGEMLPGFGASMQSPWRW